MRHDKKEEIMIFFLNNELNKAIEARKLMSFTKHGSF